MSLEVECVYDRCPQKYIHCGHMRDQRDVYRQSWLRQHVNPGEPMSLIMLVLLQLDSCNTSAYDFGGRVFDEDNVSTLQFEACT